jgi:adenosylhomocysteine nucleosidase
MTERTIGIIMATKTEAKPFITGLGLTLLEKKPVQLYGAGRVILAVSGIGMSAAAAATMALIERHSPAAVFNCGAAGAARSGLTVGEVFHIDRVVEPDRPRPDGAGPVTHAPDLLDGFATASLASRDRPVIGEADRAATAGLADLVDMEGAAVVQACRGASTPVYVFKIVTDTAGHSLLEIIGNIRTLRKHLYDFFTERILPLVGGD